MTISPPPTAAGFLAFVRTVMAITTEQLPDASPVIAMAFAISLEIVNLQINCASPLLYTLAVYNLAGHNVIVFAPDQPDAPPVPGSDPPQPYFAFTRKELKVNAWTPGVVTSTSDEGTSVSLLNPDFMKTFGMKDMTLLKTPWGRQYMEFAQRIGPLWGLS